MVDEDFDGRRQTLAYLDLHPVRRYAARTVAEGTMDLQIILAGPRKRSLATSKQ